MRKVLMLLVVLVLLLTYSGIASAETPIRVYVDGQQVELSIDPVIENYTTLVEFRPIFETLGLEVGWNQETETVTGTKNDLTIELRIGSKEALVNNQIKALLLVPRVVNGHTLVPIRFVGEASGELVTWDDATRTIQIGKQVKLGTHIGPVTFRDTKWGMSKAEVVKAEGEKPDADFEDALAYADIEITGFNSNMFYSFVDDKLYRGSYSFNHLHSNSTDYIDDYKKLKKILTDKYGEPINEIVNWKNDLWRDEPENWGMAVITGNLSYLSWWEVNGIQIILGLNGDNYEVAFSLFYTDLNMASSVKEEIGGI